MATTNDVEEKTPTKSAGRGPSYPAISLEDAVRRAQQFWNHEKRNAAPVGAAAKHWGYKETSSSWKAIVGAMLQFGLMEDSGSSASRTVRLTGRALDILLDAENSPNRVRALREAATMPKVYADILSKWPAHELPSDQTLRFYLLRERGFNEVAVASFLEDFRSSLSYAGVDKPPTITDDEPPETQPIPAGSGGESRDQTMTPPTDVLPQGNPTPTRAVPVSTGHRQDTFSLDEGQVILQFPEKMSDASYEDFKDWIELQLRKIKRSIH